MGRRTTKGGRTLNPADAHRKKQRKREIKKNKVQRKKVRELILATKNPDKIRLQIAEINKLETTGKAEKRHKTKKKQLQETLEKVLAKQAEDSKKKENPDENSSGDEEDSDPMSANFQEQYGNPTDSVYYHPTFNPYGAPPPGQAPRFRKPPSFVPPPQPSDAPPNVSFPPPPPLNRDTNTTGSLPPPPPLPTPPNESSKLPAPPSGPPPNTSSDDEPPPRPADPPPPPPKEPPPPQQLEQKVFVPPPPVHGHDFRPNYQTQQFHAPNPSWTEPPFHRPPPPEYAAPPFIPPNGNFYPPGPAAPTHTNFASAPVPHQLIVEEIQQQPELNPPRRKFAGVPTALRVKRQVIPTKSVASVAAARAPEPKATNTEPMADEYAKYLEQMKALGAL